MQTKSTLTIHALPDPVCFTIHYIFIAKVNSHLANSLPGDVTVSP